ncbi:CDP-alcohol phosphatidyltransferase family protein [Vicingaceae bacterium]|mgnify:FL=1|jgi:CDP-diacylglycerol---serine O-phosphatidyltransferase|nr:CDP-alcohol phosphatidyltransferase family protein [Vicingaceae bacterium]
MSKLPKENRFVDLSDYGRPAARVIARSLQNTPFTAIHVTIAFVITGLIALVSIVYHYYWATAFLLVLKSILDGADGELARLKNQPSYVGRYLDSVSDIILNFLILLTIWYITDTSIILTILAFIGIQLQGTLYNYYYVILRNKYAGDTTSRIFEDKAPTAMKGEKQKNVNLLFRLYYVLYSRFDKAIYRLDKRAVEDNHLPNWLMTAVSTFGLGFQLLIIGLMLAFNLEQFIIPFFIGYSVFILVFIGLRKWVN